MAKKTNSTGNILGGLVVGWQSIEPMVLGCAAARLNFIMRGFHGAAKSVFAQLMAEAIGGEHRHYDATKDDMISVAGVPNAKAIGEGELKFAKHSKTIWDATVVSVDELTRAPKEMQNIWLEIFQEKKCYGFALKYEIAIATMNPSTYAAAFRLDEALLDRFAAVVEVPNVLSGDGNEIAANVAEIIEMNRDQQGRRNPEYLMALSNAIKCIRSQYEILIKSTDVVSGIKDYISQLVREVVNETRSRDDKAGVYISPRRIVLLYNSIIACAAYYKFAQSLGMILPKGGAFVEAASMALTYVLAVPLNINHKIVLGCHNKVKDRLLGIVGCPVDQLRKSIQDSGTAMEKIAMMESSLDTIAAWTPAEIGSIANMLTEEIFEKITPKIKDIKADMNAFLAGCESVDCLCNLFSRMTEYSDASMKASGWSSLAIVKGRVIDLMHALAKEYAIYFDKDKTYICTYDKIQKNKESHERLTSVWKGRLINGSLAQTAKTILQAV